jgi:outer membrane protein TolC
MSTFRILFAALALVGGTAAAGEPPIPADLPPAEAVELALDAHPQVRAAQARLRAAQAEHERLKAGAYEYELGLASQRRDSRGGPDYTEWSAYLSRGLRLPGKADLDRRIGQQGVLEAEERVGDARHEAARQLLDLWYAARQTALEAGLWRQQATLLTDQKRIVETRLKRGDAARLDLLQAEAALAQALSQSAAAGAREQAARAELAARFPELPVPDDNAAQPVAPEGDPALWVARTLDHNHELLAAQRALEQARLLARRAAAERRPDPTLGLHLASEQGGDERIVGVSLSLPLPGGARQAEAQAGLARAQALAELEADTRRRLTAEAAVNWQRSAAGVDSWRRLEEATQAVGRHADLARRAHELGEVGLSEALLARRAALEAQLAAGQARLAANAAGARLLLDAHRLWPPGGAGHYH